MAEATSMLFVPPRAPIRLAEGMEVAIGRHPDCDIVVTSAQASRRHAIVRFAQGGCEVEDLGSTNGTLVNGRPLEGADTLTAGDRIDVGGVQITYCVVDGATPSTPLASGEGEQTLIAFKDDAAPGSQALEGDLSRIPIFAVLQMLELGAQSGRLEVEGAGLTGQVWFGSGHLVHATTEKDTAMEAALAIAGVDAGRFNFVPGDDPPEHSFHASVTEVLLESSRLLDESGL